MIDRLQSTAVCRYVVIYLRMPLFKNINRRFLWIATSLIALLCIVSFFAAWGRDEGTLGNGVITNLLADTFMVLRLPFHPLLWPIMDGVTKQISGLLFFMGLLGNSFFYAFILERTYFYAVGRKKAKAVQLEND